MKLSDIAVYDRLHAAREALGSEEGETGHGDTAIKAARRALALLQAGHLMKMDGVEEAPPPAKPAPDGA